MCLGWPDSLPTWRVLATGQRRGSRRGRVAAAHVKACMCRPSACSALLVDASALMKEPRQSLGLDKSYTLSGYSAPMQLLPERPAITQSIGTRTGLLRSCVRPTHARRYQRSAHAITTVATAMLIITMPFSVRSVAVPQSRPSTDRAAPFEVASVKANRSNAGPRGIVFQSGGLAISDLTLREIIAFAYDVPNPLRQTRIIGGPKWLDVNRFDIRAKGAGTPSTERVRLMLQALLADRFTLAIRNTTASVPIYALTRVREDGT